MINRSKLRVLTATVVAVLLCAPPAFAVRVKRPDMSLFDPASDAGRYMSVHDAETFLQGRWSTGLYLDYARKALELRNVATNQTFDIVRDALTGHVVGAVGATDWFTVGAAVPVTVWQIFFDPDTQRTTGGAAPQQQKAGLGDVRLETKFRLLDITEYNIGVAVVPHFIFPTGRKGSFISGERWTPGLTVAVEGNIHDRVWLALNAGYQYVKGQNQYFTGNANAIIDDLIRLGLGARVRITDDWAFVGEGVAETIAKNAFRLSTQTPVEMLAGVSYTPQHPYVRGLAISLMGGGGITRGVGAPKIHGVLGVSYPTPKVVTIRDEIKVQVEEKIVITQKIHFAFNSSAIRPISYPILDDVAELLRENPQIQLVEVEGHTDWVGSAEYNMRLSQRRAKSVVNYLVKHGTAAGRLSPRGYGESRPVADNNTAEGRAKNRRTEFTVVQ